MIAILEAPQPRRQLAKLLSDYSSKKLSGDEFASAVFDIRYKRDQALDLVTDYVDEVFEPEFGKPGFDPLAQHNAPARLCIHHVKRCGGHIFSEIPPLTSATTYDIQVITFTHFQVASFLQFLYTLHPWAHSRCAQGSLSSISEPFMSARELAFRGSNERFPSRKQGPNNYVRFSPTHF